MTDIWTVNERVTYLSIYFLQVMLFLVQQSAG